MKNYSLKSLDSPKHDINDKFNNINDKPVTIQSGFKENLDDLAAEIFLRLKNPSLKHSVKKIHYFIKRLKNWRVVLQCWKLI